MKHINLSTSDTFEAYGLKCQKTFPDALASQPPLGSMKSTVRPGQTSVRHTHHETEVFYLLSGHGQVVCDDESCEVEKDSVVLLPAFSSHTITNLSEHDPLEFLTFWWPDYPAIDQALNKQTLLTGQSILVTATPPTPNGDLHLGHISGPYFGADIYTRFMRLQGNEVFYLTGTDVNQTYVYTKADQQDKDPRDVANLNTEAIKISLEKSDIQYDEFYNPWELAGYETGVQAFFQQLYEQGLCIEKVSSELFDQQQYLHEAYIRGVCPHCGASSDGNCCEKCGLPHETIQLGSAKSFYSDAELQEKPVKKLYFPLEKYRQQLIEYYNTLDLAAHHSLFIEQLFSQDLPDIALSHPGPWGIKHTISGYEDQIIYVWAEMLPGFLLAAQESQAKQWQEFDRRVQFYGFDNTFYFLTLFPAMLIALGRDEALPDGFSINEFLQLEGSKFSTSREHLIWAKDFFGDKNSDVARMYLAKVRPEQAVKNFSISGFNDFEAQFVTGNLIKTLDRFWQFLNRSSANQIAEPGAWNASCKQHYRLLTEHYQAIIAAHQVETFSTQTTMSCIEQVTAIATANCDMVDFLISADDYKARLRTHLALAALALKVISIGLVGIAPKFAQRLHSELGLGDLITLDEQLRFIPGGTLVAPRATHYFPLP